MESVFEDSRWRLLKLATRKLLDKFPTLKDAAASCRVNSTNLSQYQSFEHSTFMPVDVVIDLETAICEQIVSKEMIRLNEIGINKKTHGLVRDEALDIPVAVGELLAFVCEATARMSPGGHRLTELEKRKYFELRQRVSEELEQLDAAVESESEIHFSH